MNFYFYKKIKKYTFHITVAIILVATVIIGGHFALAAETSVSEVNYSSANYLAKADSISNLDKVADQTGLKSNVSLGTRIGTIIKGILSIIGVVMLVLFIYGGFTWMTAGGNEEKVRQATKILASAVTGFILIFLSYALTNFFIQSYNKASTASTPFTTGACLIETPPGSGVYSCTNSTIENCPVPPGIFSFNDCVVSCTSGGYNCSN